MPSSWGPFAIEEQDVLVLKKQLLRASLLKAYICKGAVTSFIMVTVDCFGHGQLGTASGLPPKSLNPQLEPSAGCAGCTALPLVVPDASRA